MTRKIPAKAALEAEAADAKAAAEQAAVKAARTKAEAEERARREAHESRSSVELQQQEKELPEVIAAAAQLPASECDPYGSPRG